MARTPQNSRDTANDLENLALDAATPDEEDQFQFEQTVLSELGSSPDDIKWLITADKMQVNDKGAIIQADGDECLRFDGSEISNLHDRLREFGSGVYRVTIRKNGRIWKRKDIRLLVKEKEKSSSDMSAVLSAMQAQHEKTMAIMERLAEKNSQQPQATPQINPVEMITALGGVMATFQKMFEPATQVAAPVVAAPDPAASFREVMGLFREGVEFAQNMNPDTRSSGMTGIVERLLDSPLLAKVAEGMQQPASPQPFRLPPPHNALPQGQRPAPAPQSRPAPVQPTPGAGAAQPTPAAPSGENAADAEAGSIGEVAPQASLTAEQFLQALATNEGFQIQIKQAINYLITRAQRGADPGFYADWVLDNWPPDFVNFVIGTPSLTDTLQHFVPEIVPYRHWFDALIDECAKVVNDDAGQADGEIPDAASSTVAPFNSHGNTGRPGGGESNAGANGQAGEAGKNKPADPG